MKTCLFDKNKNSRLTKNILIYIVHAGIAFKMEDSMHTFNRSNLAIAFASIILLCTGCAKRTKIVLPPLKKADYTAKKEGVTLKLKELNEQELKEINTKGLGSYKIGRMPLNKKNNRHNRGKYVRVLYGTLINENTTPITFNRKSISLPLLPPHKSYRFSNNLMIWSFLTSVSSLALAAWGITMLIIAPQAGTGVCAIGGNYILLAAGSSTYTYSLFSILGLEYAIIGFAIGAQEVKKEKNLKRFTHDTMLSDAIQEIQPYETQSWLMVVRSHKYQEKFMVRCQKPDATQIVFDVAMPNINTF